MRQIRIKSFQFLSSLGFSLSLLCAIHCLAMPFMIAFAPFFGSFLSHTAETYILLTSASLAGYVFLSNFQQHGNFWPISLLVLSALLSFAGLLLFHDQWEIPFMASGGFCMATAYFINWKAQKKSCSTPIA
jgi:hypothetical protein